MSPAIRRPLALLPIVLLAACAARPPVIPTEPETPKQAQERRAHASRPTYNLTGYPPAVRDGYIDGCESAKKTQYARKKVALLMPSGDGWLVDGLDDDDLIVVRGAGVLWSLEGIGSVPEDDDD